jgi:DNA polymerase elongation subunit (family B)
MLYGKYIGYSNQQLYELSKKIISGSRNAFFSEAYNISYTDILDFLSAGNKMSLKKWEIKLGIHHKELGLPWNESVPEEKWIEVAEYCDNDVIAEEAVFDENQADWTARQILADVAGMTVNDTTNTLTTRIIFGNNKKPQSQFNYRDMSKPVYNISTGEYNFLKKAAPEMMASTHGAEASILPYFPGYKFENGKSIYRNEEAKEGGLVYAEPGMYINVALLDVASMHPHSAITEVIFGVEYTTIFKEIVDGRVDIKHEEWTAMIKYWVEN